MEDLSEGQVKHWVNTTPKPYAPGQGSLKSDLGVFFVVVFLQNVVLPSMDLGHLKFDLYIPWLVICLLRMHIERAMLFFLLVILLMESSTAAPSGLFLVAYSIIGIILHILKYQISWRRTISWIYAMAAATTLLGSLEAMALYLSEPSRQMGFYALTWGSRVAINSLLVFLLPTHWLSDDWMEEKK
jgi:hypothetical protein